MMIKQVVLWNPSDEMSKEEHDRLYFEEHVPLVRSFPGIRRYVTSLVIGAPDGSPGKYYRMAELYYDDVEDLQKARSSSKSAAARQQILDWKWKDVCFMVIEETEQPVGDL